MNSGSGEAPAGGHGTAGPGVVAAHLLAYAELVTVLLRGAQRSLQQRLIGLALAILGTSAFLVLVTVTVVAAAWPTDRRWPVVIVVAGLYLVLGVLGIWMLARRSSRPGAGEVLIGELRKDAHLLATSFRNGAP